MTNNNASKATQVFVKVVNNSKRRSSFSALTSFLSIH